MDNLIDLLPPPYQHILLLAGAIVYVASEICNQTQTPPPNTFWGKVYKVIEILARVDNKAKQPPTSPPSA